MDTGGPPEFGVCAAVDMLYLATGGARPTAVLASRCRLRARDGPNAPRWYPGCRPTGRVSSPARTPGAVGGRSGLGLLVVDGYADLDPSGRPGLGAHTARPAERRSCRRCPRCPGRRPQRQARGTYRSGSRPRLPRWARRAGRRHSYGTTRCTRRGAYPGDRPGHTRCWCQRRSRSQQATGRSPPRAAHRLARTRRSSRCHRSRRTPARGEIPGGPEARRRVAQAARERAKTAPRRTRRQAAATAPWLSHVQLTGSVGYR